MDTLDKKWLSNFISGRLARVSTHLATSSYRPLPNGVPQGAVLSPCPFKLFLHDLPPPPPDVLLLSYADDLSIASRNPDIKTATNQVQEYLLQLGIWLSQNRMSASPKKSTVSLFTSDFHQSKAHPHITLYDKPLPLNRNPKFLGITYDPHMTFSTQVNNITAIATRKMNALKLLDHTSFGQQK